MQLSQLRVAEPCHASWEAMEGDRVRRHCAQCDRHVHDLSMMSHDDAERLMNTTGHLPCVRYIPDASGAPLTREQLPRWVRWTRRSRWLVAACAAIGFTMNLVGCMGVPVARPEKQGTPLPATTAPSAPDAAS